MAKTATNPETGERLVLLGGEWKPFTRSATSASGKKAYLVGNEWEVEGGSANPDKIRANDGASETAKLPLLGPSLFSPVSSLLPVGEYALNLGSSIFAKPAGEIAGLAAMATGGDDVEGFKKEVQDRLTYTPRTSGGQALSTSLWNPLNLLGYAVGAGSESAGNFVGGGEAGDTLRGAAGNFVREAIPQALGFLGVKGAKPISNVSRATSDFAVRQPLYVVGKIYDVLSDRYGSVTAGNIARQAAGGDLAAMRAAMDAAGPEITAAQAGAGLKNDLWSALGDFAARNDQTSTYSRMADTLRNKQLDTVRSMARGPNLSEARKAREAEKSALNRVTTPMREDALTNANLAGELKMPLEAKSAQLGAGASQRVADVRRMADAENAAQRAAENSFPIEGMPRVPGRYTYAGDTLAPLAARLGREAASDSLLLGEAGRFSQRQADSLAAHGLRPIDTGKLVDQIGKKIDDPAIGTNLDAKKALGAVSRQIEEWAALNGGVISAEAIDGIRKHLNKTIESMLGTGEPKAIKSAAASIASKIRPMLVEAIDTASGFPRYSEYLDTFSRGMQNINRRKMAAELSKRLEYAPDTFETVVRGNEPKIVEKIFGPGNYDFVEQMGGQRPRSMALPLQRIADELRRDVSVSEGAARGAGGLARILKENYSNFHLPNWINAQIAVMNRVLQEAEVRMNRDTLNRIVTGMQTGRSAREMLDTLPTSERIAPARRAFVEALLNEFNVRASGAALPAVSDEQTRQRIEK